MSKKISEIQNKLDERGLMTTIHKVKPRKYDLAVNFNVIETSDRKTGLYPTIIKMYESLPPE